MEELIKIYRNNTVDAMKPNETLDKHHIKRSDTYNSESKTRGKRKD